MLCDALDPVTRLCTALQAKTLNFAELNFLIDMYTADLKAMMNSPDEETEHFRKIGTPLSTELKEWDLQVSDESSNVNFSLHASKLIDDIQGVLKIAGEF